MVVSQQRTDLVEKVLEDGQFQAQLANAIEQAKEENTTRIACIALKWQGSLDFVDLFERNPLMVKMQVFWRDGDLPSGKSLAIGEAVSFQAQAANVFDEARSLWRNTVAQFVGNGSKWVRFFCGQAFDPETERDVVWKEWPAGLMFLPRYLFIEEELGIRLVISLEVTKELDLASAVHAIRAELQRLSDPLERVERDFQEPLTFAQSSAADLETVESDSLQWKKAVAHVVQKIARKEFAKVVLARRRVWRAKEQISSATVLRNLLTRYETGVVFALQYVDQVFVGASPERLVQSFKQHVHIDCLAGTTARDQDLESDAQAATQLLASQKDRSEHAHVLRGILQDVQDVVGDLSYPDAPKLRSLTNVHHLYTPIEGYRLDGTTILDLVARLHPTPAVAGLPKHAAMMEIRVQEQMDRGFYAGPIGWLDAQGDGAFNVALRCGLLCGRDAVLYAGAGIVEDSNPWAEWAETEWKLQPMQTALSEE
ncbi:isochorismate synthase [Sulfoacidibacillus thermotolerans]|uniref:isochorismate synthase n=1 Tax=Sulfoacidibacillus thermotolerans TaxID=1765684 RepID=A0A2U3D9E9_SULT2|nr:isochorismate synthase [Sulfoacidibacillus thermotolerans]PWI57907.1 hypothetical protein BM613_05675 [Sulfoacidibacillus thermotolerans]